jgi:hypothetical protein
MPAEFFQGRRPAHLQDGCIEKTRGNRKNLLRARAEDFCFSGVSISIPPGQSSISILTAIQDTGGMDFRIGIRRASSVLKRSSGCITQRTTVIFWKHQKMI